MDRTLNKDQLEEHYLKLSELGSRAGEAHKYLEEIISAEIERLVTLVSSRYDEQTPMMLADLRAWTKLRTRLEFDMSEGTRARKALKDRED